MVDTHRFSVSVAGAIEDDQGRFLCIKRRDNGHWEPPGGLVEPGETLLEALVREVQEETGYKISPGRVTGVYQNLERDIVAVLVAGRVVGGTARLSEESAQVAWLPASDVDELMDEAYAVRLLDSRQAAASLRAHDGVQVVR
ncbi:NUDIX hydrolase [Nocardioides caldifontis]|uniref:NUDIX hydrolase n=1 Tax=Nocardioides caldifontis TaxID=2588938 RepID=UPI0011DF2B8C|nr:NUDIX domain-containing protein [Nocardioides caldifontis]